MKLLNTCSRNYSLVLALVAVTTFYFTPLTFAQQPIPELPMAKQTELGLYMTAKEAYGKWQADPDNVLILDVRTTEEYLFVGHATMAWNVPLMSQSYEWDEDKQYFSMRPNLDFTAQVKELAEPSDTILVMCRSGGRSAMAANNLAEAGFTNVYNIFDGMEGDVIKDPESIHQGQRLKNGWKNSGAPWTYEPDPTQMRFVSKKPEERSE